MELGPVKTDDASVKALNYILEAWEEGTESGIAPELMAYAALYTALDGPRGLLRRGIRWSASSTASGRACKKASSRSIARATEAARRGGRALTRSAARLITISPISTQPKPIITRPAMRLIWPSRTMSSRCRIC